MLACALLASMLLACSSIKVRDAHRGEAHRGDVRSGSRLGPATREAILAAGLDAALCAKQPVPCIAQLREQVQQFDSERRLAALAELQLADALAAERAHLAPNDVLDRYVEVARYAYAYLFFSERTPEQRVFESRQADVRAYYNEATEQIAQRLFVARRASGATASLDLAHAHVRAGELQVHMPAGQVQPSELVPVSRLRFDGVRSRYRRDGFGAAFVAIAAEPARVATLHEPRFLAATVVVRFAGDKLADVLAGGDASIDVYDPYRTEQVRVGAHGVPLAADFTAPYALWLSRTNFRREAGRALFRSAAALSTPEIHLLQPYDPERRTLVLLHGLASSPETWLNLANEIMGDETLRRRYQILQVFYPTNLPIAENRRAIQAALLESLAALDPDGTAPASRNITLIGHSMGGVIARLLVVESGDSLWRAFFGKAVDDARRKRFAMLDPYLELHALPQVDRAIFLASPHRGSPVASGWIGHLGSRLVRLPVTALQTVALVADTLQGEAPELALELRTRRMDSIDALSDQGRYLKATSGLPIAAAVTYHSIIGRSDPAVALESSTDGFVPYASSHLDGAASELVVTSGHGVQQTPAAILEIRRILRAAGP
jgi:pimeloyl-ACP methyl ester carboxylesterase